MMMRGRVRQVCLWNLQTARGVTWKWDARVVERDVDGEPLCLVMISGLILAAGRTLNVKRLNHNEASANSSSDVDGVGGRVPNCEEGIESEDEMPGGDKVKREWGWMGAEISKKHQ